MENIKHLSHKLYPMSLILQLSIAVSSCHSICQMMHCTTTDSPPQHFSAKAWWKPGSVTLKSFGAKYCKVIHCLKIR